MGVFGTNKASLHLVKPETQEEFLSKPNSVVTGKQFARFSFF
jgi:hypothetical protein